MHHLPPRLPRARTPPLLLQQPLRGLPSLPGLRQHHRLRPQPHHPRQIEVPRRRRHRPLDHHEVPPTSRRDDSRRQSRQHPHQRSLVRSHRLPTTLHRRRRRQFPGIQGFFRALERKKYKLHVRVFLSKYRGYALCPDCRGQRLRAEARAVLIAPLNGPARTSAKPPPSPSPTPKPSSTICNSHRHKPKSPERYSKRSASASTSSTRSASTTSPSTASAPRSRAANRSASSSPRHSARASSAHSTCSTNPASASTPATPPNSSAS